MVKYCGTGLQFVLLDRGEHFGNLNKPVEWPISPAGKSALVPASHTVVAADHASRSPMLEPAQKLPDARCLWCGRAFKPRSTGGSAQKFCGTGHRQEFWIAARRWTMRAIDAGLLSVDCLKASQASVHAAGGAFR
jgi:hypothetical protein